MMNTKPLFYVDSGPNADQILRPIDFLQNDFEIPFPLNTAGEDDEDPTYNPPNERVTLQSKMQVNSALKSSCETPEKFWDIWQTQYTNVRSENSEAAATHQKKEKLVLICDNLQPRHSWKMGRIDELKETSDGTVREAVVILPSHRKIRRPINLLVPLELEDDHAEEHKEDDSSSTNCDGEATPNHADKQLSDNTTTNEGRTVEEPEGTSFPRYNLRPRQRVTHSEHVRRVKNLPLMLCTLLAMFVLSSSSLALPAQPVHSSKQQIRCITGGVELVSPQRLPYQICAEDFCKTLDKLRINDTIRFPPQIILHEHVVQWKFEENGSIRTIETACPAAPLCDNIDCTVCAAVVFNPECWPVGPIVITAIIIYFVLTGCYVFLYIPLVSGKPFRVLSSFFYHVIRFVIHTMLEKCRQNRRRRANVADLTELLAVAMIAAAAVEASFKLRNNRTAVHEIRATWSSLSLTCEPESISSTCDTTYHVIDSKRCQYTGSCVGSK
ncbi:hypothetical protein ANCDUO_13028 [Ancylostoma duodenale]|uniref:DUF5641 domain-containing protein n=1 Tax=Ancylostoma duodenale TaxID=51022 RepID=A0A0C2G735_9BILA|nr:hypothetical protein ANCDUO_13028 [Ancylostoma duodenale]